MVNDIVNSVTATIYKAFGDQYHIYTENIEQGFKEPCFFVAVLEPTIKRYIGNRHLLTVPLDVHYFPQKGHKNNDMHNVAILLHGALQQLTLLDNDMLNGLDMHYEIVSDVLHFFVSYKPIIIYEAVQAPFMGDMALNNHAKGGI